jgi:hypothetical protein
MDHFGRAAGGGVGCGDTVPEKEGKSILDFRFAIFDLTASASLVIRHWSFVTHQEFGRGAN